MKYTPFVTTWLFYIFLLTIPVWLINASLIHIILAYIFYWFISDFVNSAFLHKWASHKAWNPPRWVQYVLSFAGVVFLLGTPITWSAWHRTHHKHSDTDKDPHSPDHKGWLYCTFKHRYHEANFKLATDKMRDKYFIWLTKNELYIVVLSHIVLFSVLGTMWYLTLIAVPTALAILFTNLFVNVISHLNGEVSNIPWAWPFVFADAWHKDHHYKPNQFNGKLDISGNIIKALKWT